MEKKHEPRKQDILEKLRKLVKKNGESILGTVLTMGINFVLLNAILVHYTNLNMKGSRTGY